MAHEQALAHYSAMAEQASRQPGAVTFYGYGTAAVTPQLHAKTVGVQVHMHMTTAQRWAAVEALLSTGMSEQDAFEGMRGLFPGWFEQVTA